MSIKTIYTTQTEVPAGTHRQTRLCLETWIGCENLLASCSETEVAPQWLHIVDTCAHICMETWQALKDGTPDKEALVLMCIGICTECAEQFAQSTNLRLRSCAASCRNCADGLSLFAQATVYN